MTCEALTKADVPFLADGNFLTVAVNSITLALIILMMIWQVSRLKKAQA
jgi:large conductance mechanosensitive channel